MTVKAKNGRAPERPDGFVSIGDAEPVEWEGRQFQLPFTVVAIGASAGGVEVLRRLFAALPVDSGCAFVVVMHLAPDLHSNLDTLVGHATAMKVEQATDGLLLEPNQVYIAPPGYDLELRGGALLLEKRTRRLPNPGSIDRFMISLAASQGERAIGVVLSGSDADGAIGIKAIKSEGGFAIAQTPDSAAHPGMPLSAIETGVVDRQLTIEEMPQAICELARSPTGDGAAAAEASDDEVLVQILEHVRVHKGMDFRDYKRPMLTRRVHRRMSLSGHRRQRDYLRYLSETPSEVEGLAADFLISVTEFFREPEAWKIMNQEVVPDLLEAKQEGDSVRVWVAGCATGEEAYSLAMTFLEHPLLEQRGLKLQVLATDIDNRALETARRGAYAAAIHHSVSSTRLQRFFIRTEEGYKVQKALRDTVMFAPQNLVNDPPFSHLDLVSCRNLLIYMQPELQRRVLETFHFALDAGGLLALGKSETAGAHQDLFVPLSQRARIFRRVGPARVALRLPLPSIAPAARRATSLPPPALGAEYGRLVRDVLLERQFTAAVLTNAIGQPLYFYGSVHPYLEAPQGAPSTDLFMMVRKELRPQLRAVLRQVAKSGEPAQSKAVMSADGQGRQSIRLTTWPVGRPGDGLLMISFELIAGEQKDREDSVLTEIATVRALEDELRSTRHELRIVIAELEATNEELKVANEEAMSANEELQSSNEELQTSKEELQAMNEELTTVNSQLTEKVGELETLNDDLNNLLSSSHIPTLFLDRQLNIKRFTPAAMRLFRLIPGDINRPVSDLASFTDLELLVEDARRVLETLTPIERETRTADGNSFLRRTLPYKTIQDRIEGVVVTFTDITELKRAAEGLRRYATVMRDSNDAVIVHDLEGRILAWNRSAQAIYGYPESDVLQTNFAKLLPEEARADFLIHLDRTIAGERLVGVEMRRRRQDGSMFEVAVTFSMISSDTGLPVAVALTERDISKRRQMQAQVQESERRFRLLANQAPVLIWICEASGVLEFVNHEYTVFTGLTEEALLHRRLTELLHPDDVARLDAQFSTQGVPWSRREATARLRNAQGDYRWMKITAGAQDNGKMVGSMLDIHAQVEAEQGMRDANRRKDEFLAMLGHELRNPLVPIRNAAEVLNHVAGEDSRVAWVRDTLVRQVEHVTCLVDDLLDISTITRGTMRLHREPVDLGFIVKRACEATAGLMRRKRHQFDCQVPDQPIWVEGDAVRLAQILENLLTNAAKYTDEEGRVSLALRREKKHAVIEVSDNGMGMEPRMLERVFDLFVQDARSVDRSQGGLGIGLALVRHLVDLHCGKITAFSEGLGRGSRIVLSLPRLATPPKPAVLIEEKERVPGRGRIMIVDDDIDGGESLEVLLEMYGYEVQRAVDLPTSLEVARRLRPQVVILDLALPGADGFEVARRLRMLPEMGGRVHYLSLSGFGQPHDFRNSQEAGFVDHLVKPTDPGKLDKILKSLFKDAADEAGG